jgi:DNA-binding CsgD family transcriptional regulator
VLLLVAEAKTNREIAAMLFLSENTVKVHLRNALHKLGLSRRGEAVALVNQMQSEDE